MITLKPKYILCFISLISLQVFADTIVVDPASRQPLIERAEVWFAPSWISPDGTFAATFNPADAPTEGAVESRLLTDTISCTYVFEGPSTGANPKFKCDLSAPDFLKNPLRLKVKYGATNGEVWGEVLASRLLWSLGFGADREFFVGHTICQGCNADPVHQNAIDPQLTTTFSPTAIERKFPGTEIEKLTDLGQGKTRASLGWGFEELAFVSSDPTTAARQTRDREALTLLAIFINHLDNRKVNQRLVCIDGITVGPSGPLCSGKTAMIIQDVGSTFGGGYDPKAYDLIKVDFEAWSAKTIWTDAATCTGGVSAWGSQNLKTAQISEEGRQFLLSLLKGFAADRSRVERLFKIVSIETRGGHSAKEWADVFIRKISEIENPTGTPGFVCPAKPKPASLSSF